MSSTPFAAAAPKYTLFDSNAVALATLFGTPAAGGSLMALNYRRLGQGSKGAMTLIVTIVVAALAILITWNLPRGVTTTLGLGLLLGTRWSARSLQGQAVKDHTDRGGRLGSKGGAFVFGLAIFGAIFICALIGFRLARDPSITIGANDEISYSGTATKSDARALGNSLKQIGYLKDRGVSVSLAKGTEGAIVSFVVKRDAWKDPNVVSQFEEIGREVAPAVGGFPIRVRLLNTDREVQEESGVGKAPFGKDDVYYAGAAREKDARALGKALTSAGFFENRGADVFLARHRDGVALSFVVGQAVWDNPALVSQFEKIVRQAAPSVGGLPVKLRLVNTSLEAKKVEEITQ
ncbi:MAG: hypothetical protein JO340_07355 [Acidobacteriaceae bacterium]|nr:hypothetical protein [Acidobacteriaceae bacterium]